MANEEEKSKENLISGMNYLMDDGTFNINGWGSDETIQSEVWWDIRVLLFSTHLNT